MTNKSDIAKICNVHRTTVSKVLNDDPKVRVSTETKKKIIDTAKRLGYSFEKIAPSISATCIGFSTPDEFDAFQHPFFTDVYSGVVKACDDFKLNIMHVRNNSDQDLQCLFKSVGFFGLIGITRFSPKLIDAATRLACPLVSIEGNAEVDNPTYSIYTDNFDGAYKATKYLNQIGRKYIYFIAPANPNGEVFINHRLRREGFIKALTELGQDDAESKVIEIVHNQGMWELGEREVSIKAGYEGLNHIISNGSLPDGIVTYNDLTAHGVYNYCQEHGIAIPDKISIIGYDDLSASSALSPGLSTISVPRKEMGYEAVRLLRKINEGEEVDQRLKFENPLLIRGSTS